jgi:hypothetical protein
MSGLPTELWLLVLSFASTASVLAVSRTCRALCVVARDWTVWHDRWVSPQTWSKETAAVYVRVVRRLGCATWRFGTAVHHRTVAEFMDSGGTVDAVSLTAEEIIQLRPCSFNTNDVEKARFRRLLSECRHLVINSNLTLTLCARLLATSSPCIFPNVERLVCATGRADDDMMRRVAVVLHQAFPSPRLSVALRIQLPRKATLDSGLECLAAVPAITSLAFYSPYGIAAAQLQRVLASVPNVTTLTFTVANVAVMFIGDYGRVLQTAPRLQSVTVVAVLSDRIRHTADVCADVWIDVGRRSLASRNGRFRFCVSNRRDLALHTT